MSQLPSRWSRNETRAVLLRTWPPPLVTAGDQLQNREGAEEDNIITTLCSNISPRSSITTLCSNISPHSSITTLFSAYNSSPVCFPEKISSREICARCFYWEKLNAYKLFYFDINKIGPDIELESQSINAFMAVIVKDYNSQNTGQAAFIDSFAMTAMWQGKSPRLKKMNQMNYEIILGINNQHHHWTLVFAEKILSKEVVDFPVSNEAVYSMRLEIAVRLILNSDDLKDLCHFCGEMESDSDVNWIQCDLCLRHADVQALSLHFFQSTKPSGVLSSRLGLLLRKTTFRAEPLKALRVALVVLFEPVDQQTLTLRGRRETNVLTEEEEAEQSVMDAHVGALLFGCCLSSLFTPLSEGAPPPKRANGAPPLQQPAGGCRLFLDPFLVPLLSTFAVRG
ncbi:unnamed protein product [Menidia menidia]|uniref:(Atlantic silverside) hypothetical protein n=1 Tax=Menidia menidia TaxID=238744 RepID=A0A8S4AQQ3_9TELE|nr:unnamed protein product [Menidia menidia]